MPTTQRISYLAWIKNKSKSAHTKGVVNLATSGIATDFADQWLDQLIRTRASDILGRSEESNEYGLPSLKQAIRTAFRMPTDREIAVTSGASGGIRLVCEMLLAGQTNAEVIVETPSYEPLRAIPARFGARVLLVDRHKAGSITRLVSENTLAVFLTNLHNPTGDWLTPDVLLRMCRELEAIGSSALVVVDETFCDVGPQPGASASAIDRRIITIGSLSKSHGLPALRCGWVSAHRGSYPGLLGDWVLFQNTGCRISEVAGLLAMEEIDAFRRAARRHLKRNHEIVDQWLPTMTRAGLIEPTRLPYGNVLFPRLSDGCSTAALVEQLLERYGVLVTPGRFFGDEFDDHLRIGIAGNQDALNRGLDRLSEGLTALRRVGP